MQQFSSTKYQLGDVNRKHTAKWIVNLHNRTEEEKRRKILCGKPDNNFFLKKLSAELHLPLNRYFPKRPKDMLMLSEDHDKTRKL